MAGVFDTTQGAQLLTTYINRKFLPALEIALILQKFTTKATLPPGQGRVARITTFSNPPGSTSALTDGTIGNSVDITVTGYNITVDEYGEYMHVPTINEGTMVGGMRDEVAKRFAFGGSKAIDTLVRNQFAANTSNVRWFTASAVGLFDGSGVPTTCQKVNAAGVITAKAVLTTVGAVGHTGVPSHPEGQFAFICGPTGETDMVAETTTGRTYWTQAVVNVPGRMGQEKWVQGYMGSIYGTACYSSPNVGLTTWSASTTCSNNFFCGDGAVGALGFPDMDAQVIINTPGPNSTDNKFRNFISVSWHAVFGTKILDMNRSIRIYSSNTGGVV